MSHRGAARAPKPGKTPIMAARRRCRRHLLFFKIKVRPRPYLVRRRCDRQCISSKQQFIRAYLILQSLNIYVQQKLTFCLLSNHLDPVLFVFFIDLCFELSIINQVSCIAFVTILQLILKCITKNESNHEKTSNRLHEKTCSRQTCRNRKQRKFKSISQI